jgi:hypothetical protein
MAYRPEPSAVNHFLAEHAALLLGSLRHCTGRNIVDNALPLQQQAEQLFHASFVIASHDAAADPVFNYGNKTALALWEISWEDFVVMPSRLSAEPLHQAERRKLLTAVNANGFVDNYQGIRISAQGRRFIIRQATLWNLVNHDGSYCGQAVMFRHWQFI